MTARIVPDGSAGREEAVRSLLSGGLVALPTDTVYGIAVASSTSGGLECLFAAKRRPPDRAIVLLLADDAQAFELAVLGPAGEVLAAAFWPGGLTIVARRGSGDIPALTLASAGAASDREPLPTVGVRVPDHPAPRAIAARVGPLPTTSANLSGSPEARDAAAVAEQLGGSLDLILDGGPAPGPKPSTVVDVSGPAARILRVGAVPISAIRAALLAAGQPGPAEG